MHSRASRRCRDASQAPLCGYSFPRSIPDLARRVCVVCRTLGCRRLVGACMMARSTSCGAAESRPGLARNYARETNPNPVMLSSPWGITEGLPPLYSTSAAAAGLPSASHRYMMRRSDRRSPVGRSDVLPGAPRPFFDSLLLTCRQRECWRSFQPVEQSLHDFAQRLQSNIIHSTPSTSGQWRCPLRPRVWTRRFCKCPKRQPKGFGGFRW